jgi:hypothetical protein
MWDHNSKYTAKAVLNSTSKPINTTMKTTIFWESGSQIKVFCRKVLPPSSESKSTSREPLASSTTLHGVTSQKIVPFIALLVHTLTENSKFIKTTSCMDSPIFWHVTLCNPVHIHSGFGWTTQPPSSGLKSKPSKQVACLQKLRHLPRPWIKIEEYNIPNINNN